MRPAEAAAYVIRCRAGNQSDALLVCDEMDRLRDLCSVLKDALERIDAPPAFLGPDGHVASLELHVANSRAIARVAVAKAVAAGVL